MIRLSKRMQALADMVSPGNVLCDVGCDHGYLPIYLVQKGVIPRAIAMDVAEGPLLAARTHIKEHGLSQVIETRRSDGLEDLSVKEADSILIAGMGGGLVMQILSRHPQVAKSAKELILQPQSELYEVRRFLWQQGYELLQEDMVKEDGKYYPMMKVTPGREVISGKRPTEGELYFGSRLLADRHPVLGEFILWEERIQCQVLQQLEAQQQTDAIALRRQQVREYLQIIEECKYETKGLNT